MSVWGVGGGVENDQLFQPLSVSPPGSTGPEHGFDAPWRAKEVEGFGEAVIINETSVDGEKAHQQDDVAPAHQHGHDLEGNNY